MKNTTKVFYDGLENVRLTDGVVHLEFFNLAESGDTPKREPAGEVVLSQPAFLRMYGAMTSLIGQLEAAGLIKRTAPAAEKAPDAAAGNDAPASPNFQ